MKLSLYKQLVRNGEDSEAIFNPGEMGAKLFDVKTEGMLRLNPDFGRMLCLLSVNNLGCLVYVIKPLFSRQGDYRALVAAVPRKAALAVGGDLPAIVRDMADTLANDDDTAKMAHWFQKEYAEQDFAWDIPGQRSRYAFRLYKGNGAATLLGAALLQDSYRNYEGVFILPDHMRDIVRQEAMDDLTGSKTPAAAVVIPPVEQCRRAGCSLAIDGKAFDQPILRHVGETLKITLKREGCVDQEMKAKISNAVENVALADNLDWKLKVYVHCFDVVGEDDQPIRDGKAKLEIAGQTGVNKREQYIEVPEGKAQKARLTVTREGYETKTLTTDLTKLTKDSPLKIKLKRERRTTIYKVAGTKVTFELERTDEEAALSPLPDYEVGDVKDGVVTLRRKATARKSGKKGTTNGKRATLADMAAEGYDERGGDEKGSKPLRVSKWAIYRLLAGLFVGLVIGLGTGWWAGARYGKQAVREEMEQQRQAQEKRKQQETDSIMRRAIINYLDSVPNWKQKEMDSLFNGKLKGLYDALNTYDFTTVQSRGEELQLGESKQWQVLDSVLDRMNEKPAYREKLFEITKNGEGDKKFFSPDGTITFATLFAKLEEARNQVDSVK